MQHLFIENEKANGMLGEETIADDFARLQYTHADPQSARDALLYAVEIHRKMQISNAKYWGNFQKVDLAWSYAELSALEDSAGNGELAKDYMAQADQIFKQLAVKDAILARVKQVIRDTEPKTSPNRPENGEPR